MGVGKNFVNRGGEKKIFVKSEFYHGDKTLSTNYLNAAGLLGE